MSDSKSDTNVPEKNKINFGDIYISEIPKDGGKPKVIAAMTNKHKWVDVLDIETTETK